MTPKDLTALIELYAVKSREEGDIEPFAQELPAWCFFADLYQLIGATVSEIHPIIRNDGRTSGQIVHRIAPTALN